MFNAAFYIEHQQQRTRTFQLGIVASSGSRKSSVPAGSRKRVDRMG